MKSSWGKVRIGVVAALSAAAFAVISVATRTVSHAQLAASPWPMFHHDLRHTGLSGVNTSANPGTQKWKFATGAAVMSSPALGTDGTIYVGSFDDNVYALNPAGTLKWKFATGGAAWSSPAVGADGTIYIGSEDNNLYALNPNGTLKWKFASGNQVDSSPAVGTDGTIYFLTLSASTVYALNPNGTLRPRRASRHEEWFFQEDPGSGWWGLSSPAVGADGTIYVGSNDEYFYALNHNGTQKWVYVTSDSIAWSSPSVGADGTIYVGGYYDLCALNPNGTQKWASLPGLYVDSSPAVGADGTIYVGSDKLYAFNSDGTLKWKFAIGASPGASPGNLVESSPAVGADGTIYVGGGDNNLHALNPNGTLKWKFATGGPVESSPAVGADGTLYFGSDDNNVYAVGPPLPAPVNCKSLVLSIENMRHHGPPGPRFTAAQWAQIQNELQQCVAEHQLTQSQADGAMAGGNSYINNLPNSGPPLRGTPMQ